MARLWLSKATICALVVSTIPVLSVLMIWQSFAIYSFTSGIPVVGNLTILYTLLSSNKQIGSQSYFDRPAIETTERYVSPDSIFNIHLSTHKKKLIFSQINDFLSSSFA